MAKSLGAVVADALPVLQGAAVPQVPQSHTVDSSSIFSSPGSASILFYAPASYRQRHVIEVNSEAKEEEVGVRDPNVDTSIPGAARVFRSLPSSRPTLSG